MRRAAWLATAAMSMLAAAPGSGIAQSVAARVDAVRDGVVQLSIATRPGVCGDGRGSTWFQGPDDASTFNRGYPCIRGPLRVSIGRSEGHTVSIRTCVACRPKVSGNNDVELGDVSAPEAAHYLLGIGRTAGSQTASAAIGAAAMADSVDLTPDLTKLVHDEDATTPARRDAVFWLSQAGATATLIDIARTDRNMELRKQAMFWLGQSHDPKALKFFHDVLTP